GAAVARAPGGPAPAGPGGAPRRCCARSAERGADPGDRAGDGGGAPADETVASIRDPDDARGRSRGRAARRVDVRARSRAPNAAAGRADAPDWRSASLGRGAAQARAPGVPV